MATEKTTYELKRYTDGATIGTCNLTAAEFCDYQRMAQQPEGLIRLGAMPHSYYDLAPEYQGEHKDTTVYLD